MTSGVKLRLAALGLAMAIMGGLIAFVTLYSQRQFADLRVKLNEVDAQSSSMAEHFKDMLRDGSDKLTRFRNTGDAAAWTDFLKASDELKAWIQNQIAGPVTPHESGILCQMTALYPDYLQVAGEIQKAIQAAGPDKNLPPDLTEKLGQTRRRLFDLGQDLSKAHRT